MQNVQEERMGDYDEPRVAIPQRQDHFLVNIYCGLKYSEGMEPSTELPKSHQIEFHTLLKGKK